MPVASSGPASTISIALLPTWQVIVNVSLALVISPLLDCFGAKKVILFAAACFIVGPALVLMSANAGGFDDKGRAAVAHQARRLVEMTKKLAG